jgi:hypothetical protein
MIVSISESDAFAASLSEEAKQRRKNVTPLFEQALKGQLDNLKGDKLFSTNHAR